MAQALPVIAAVTGLVGAGTALYGATRKPDIPKVEPPPPVPDIEALPEPTLERRAGGRQSTILTRPSGLGEPLTLKPTLLGQ